LVENDAELEIEKRGLAQSRADSDARIKAVCMK
jgi:hypothetical protein